MRRNWRNNSLKNCEIKKNEEKEEKNIVKNFVCMEKVVSLHRFEILGYGVTVTLQILVLSFLVRIQVAQQKSSVY